MMGPSHDHQPPQDATPSGSGLGLQPEPQDPHAASEPVPAPEPVPAQPVAQPRLPSESHQDAAQHQEAATPTGPESLPLIDVNGIARKVSSTFEGSHITSMASSLTSWGLGQFKHAKQVVLEKFGNIEKTQDPELEDKIERLTDIRMQYLELMKTCEALLKDIVSSCNNQALLARQLSDLSIKQPELRAEFERNARTQQAVSKHAEPLIATLKFFLSNLSTICDKTMQDCLDSIHSYNGARIDYDVLRLELQQQDAPADPARETELEAKRQRYEKAKESINIKLQLLHENRQKVLRKQLLLLNNAMVAYYQGDVDQLKEAVAQISTGYDVVDTAAAGATESSGDSPL